MAKSGNGKKINVTRNEFRKSFQNHYTMYLNTKNGMPVRTRRLILFYAVECGLKSLILKKIGKNTYYEMEAYYDSNGKKIRGHDLKEMTKEVGIEAAYPLKDIQLKGDGTVLPQRYNELWRYGAAVQNEAEEEREEKTLLQIAKWIYQRI
mgnify:CR=1 FL=1